MLTLLRQRNFALLWFAGLISLIGDWMLMIGLPIYVYLLTHSALATSLMFIAGILPQIALGSVAGVFVDRWDRKRVMIITNILLALCLLPLLLFHSVSWLWVVYSVAFLESLISQFFTPAESALLPRLVNEEHLASANSVSSLNGNLARLIGPPLGGIVAGLLGLNGIALLDAASFMIAAVLIMLITVNAQPVKKQVSEATKAKANPWRDVWHEWLEGLRLVKQERNVAAMFALIAITSLGEGVFAVLVIAYVSKVLHGGALQLGWLQGAQAIGGLIGGLLIGFVVKKVSLPHLIGFGAIAVGFIDLLIFNYPTFFPGIVIGLALFVLVGIPGVGFSTGVTTLLQTSVEDKYRGRIFGAMGTTSAILMLVGTTLAGLLGDPLGVVTVLNTQGGMYVLAGICVLVLLRPVIVKETAQVEQELVEMEAVH
ncbi:MAG: MFS transporter [Ktedonobacteraceae bacterium]